MPTIRVDLDIQNYRKLAEIAVAARRPVSWQAEVLLLRALGVSVEGIAQGTQPQSQEVPCAAE